MSKASRAREEFLVNKQSIQLGDYNVTPGWKYYSGGTLSGNYDPNMANNTLVYNPANPSESFMLNSRDARISEIQEFLNLKTGNKAEVRDHTEVAGLFPSGTAPVKTFDDIARDKYASELMARYQAGEISSTQVDDMINSFDPSRNKTESQKIYDDAKEKYAAEKAKKANRPPLNSGSGAVGQSTTPGGAPIGGLQMDYHMAIAEIYAKRPDLQGLYGADGRAINPNDPRTINIPTILDWAEQYGAKEYSALNGYSKATAGSSSRSTASSGNNAGNGTSIPSTGNAQLDQILSQLQTQITNAQANGQMINPNIELTPAEVKKFLDQATKEIDPYYSSQITAIRQNLDRSLDELEQSYQIQKKQDEADFKKTLGNKREDLAGTGLAFSGVRGNAEKTLAEDQNRSLESTALSVKSKARGLVTDAENRIGSRNLASLKMPNLVQYGASTGGDGSIYNKRTLNFDGLGNITGDLEYSKNRDIRTLSDYLQTQAVKKKTLNF